MIFIFTFDDKYIARILGSQIPNILIGCIIFFHFIKKSIKIEVYYFKYALKICLPFIPHLLALNFLSSIDKIMITKYCGSHYTALYSMAVNCGLIVSLLLSSINNAISPWIGEKIYKKEYNEIYNLSKSYITFLFVFSIGIILISPDIIFILGGTKYTNSIGIVPPIIISVFFQAIYTLYVNVEQFEKKTIGMAISSVFAAIVNVILNMILIPKFGYVSAAYTTLLGYLILMYLHAFFVNKMNIPGLFDYKYNFFISFASLFLIVLIQIIYSYKYLRYIFLSIYLIIILMILNKYKYILTKILRSLIK